MEHHLIRITTAAGLLSPPVYFDANKRSPPVIPETEPHQTNKATVFTCRLTPGLYYPSVQLWPLPDSNLHTVRSRSIFPGQSCKVLLEK